MIIVEEKVSYLTITGAHNLDPIYVTLHDLEPRKGRITFACWDKAWVGYWGGMGDQTIGQFFSSMNSEYIANCVCGQMPHTVVDAESIEAAGKERVAKLLADHEIDQDEAEELNDKLDSYCTDDPHSESDLMLKIFGDEWWCILPSRPNPEYEYLCRVIAAVQEGLRINQTSQVPA